MIRIVIIKVKPQGVLVDIDIVPDLLSSLVVNIGRWRRRRKRRVIEVERVVHRIGIAIGGVIEGMGGRWRWWWWCWWRERRGVRGGG